MTHGHHHVYTRSTSLDNNLKISFVAAIYKSQLVETREGISCYRPHS